MYAALGDGDRALASLNTYFDKYDRPNTMYTEVPDNPSPVMETPLSAARCVQDMLLQSHDVIRSFPHCLMTGTMPCFTTCLPKVHLK